MQISHDQIRLTYYQAKLRAPLSYRTVLTRHDILKGRAWATPYQAGTTCYLYCPDRALFEYGSDVEPNVLTGKVTDMMLIYYLDMLSFYEKI